MRRLLPKCLFILYILVLAAPAHAVIEVAFIKPAGYSDAAVKGGPFGSGSLGVVNAIRNHLMDLGNNNLSPSEGLRIEVLDIDLAGRYEWWRFPFDKRVMRKGSVPSIDVRYIYYVDGKKVDEREEQITDTEYLQSAAADNSGDALRFEKAMLDRWFRDRFINHESASN